MNLVKLKNGTEEVEPVVKVVMMNLSALWEEGLPGVLAVYDLVERCRDSNYQFFGSNEQKLKELALVESDGRINNSIRNIVLSAAQGTGREMQIGSPVAG